MEQTIHIKQTYKQKYNFTKIPLLFVLLVPSLFCHSILYGLVDVEWHYICGRKSSVLAYVRINHILCVYVWFSSIRRTIRIEKSHLKIAICSWSENKLQTTKEETMKRKCTKNGNIDRLGIIEFIHCFGRHQKIKHILKHTCRKNERRQRCQNKTFLCDCRFKHFIVIIRLWYHEKIYSPTNTNSIYRSVNFSKSFNLPK